MLFCRGLIIDLSLEYYIVLASFLHTWEDLAGTCNIFYHQLSGFFANWIRDPGREWTSHTQSLDAVDLKKAGFKYVACSESPLARPSEVKVRLVSD